MHVLRERQSRNLFHGQPGEGNAVVRVAEDGPGRGDTRRHSLLEVATQVGGCNPIAGHRAEGAVADAAGLGEELRKRDRRLVSTGQSEPV